MREIIQVEYKFLGNNFVPPVLTIGGMGLALHYKELAIQYDVKRVSGRKAHRTLFYFERM